MKPKISHPLQKVTAGMLAVLAVVLGISAGMPDSEFHILKSRNGVDLYYRWMEMPDGRVRQMKAVVSLSATSEEVVALLKDESRALHWLSSAEQFRHLEDTGNNEWVSYIHFSVPWPLSDQDCILEFTSTRGPLAETVIDFACNPTYMEEVDGISRIRDVNGRFVLRPCGGGDCLLECYFLSKKASVIPRWITEPIITGNIMKMLEAMREELTVV